jgi:hypothetical protein
VELDSLLLHISSEDHKNRSQADREQIAHVNAQLGAIWRYRQRFSTALVLADYLWKADDDLAAEMDEVQKLKSSDPSRYIPEYRRVSDGRTNLFQMVSVPYRDAIMTIYHLHKILILNLVSQVALSPFLKSRISLKDLAKARAPFLAAFPKPEALRNAVAHSAETSATKASIQKHAGDQGLELETIRGRIFSTMNEGVVYTFELNSAALSAIDSTLANVRKALIIYPGNSYYENLAARPLG